MKAADQRILVGMNARAAQLSGGARLINADQPQPLGPRILPGQDGKQYAVPQVHAVTLEPHLIDLIATRAAYIVLCAEHGHDEAVRRIDVARAAGAAAAQADAEREAAAAQQLPEPAKATG